MKSIGCLLISLIFLASSLDAVTILLDPGHGGVYHGRASATNLFLEKDMALTLSKLIARRLKKYGYTVKLTRTCDKEFNKKDLIKDLEARAQMTFTHQADILVSIHLNASPNKKHRAFEIYVPYEEKYQLKSYLLASCIHSKICKINPRFGAGSLGNVNSHDSGIRAAKFNVLCKSHCPAVLLELDYLTNPQAEKELMTTTYQNTLADVVSTGIHNYFGYPRS